MKNKVDVFDTTLRDGEQAAGIRLGPAEKLALAKQLERLGVDIIEAGFPISSPEDMEAVKMIAKEVRTPVICALSRAVKEDIDACGQAIADAAKPRIHTGLGVSDIHVMKIFGDERYGKTLEEKRQTVLRMSVEGVKRAKEYADDVVYYAMDAGRAEPKFLMSLYDAVIEAGANVLNIPDTTGYAMPEQFGAMIAEVGERAKGKDIVLSVHCHDDLGLAVSNSLAGVLNGARQVEGTILGIGERAGNAALEEIIMALETRKDYFNISTTINTKELYKTSRMVADAFAMDIPANKAVIGTNAFSHSSGIHVDGVLKERQTFEIMLPADIGAPATSVVLTARTGRHGVRHRLEKLGYNYEGEELERIYERFLKIADKKREVFDEDLVAIIHDEVHSVPSLYVLDYLHTTSGTGTIPTATVRLKIGDEIVQGSQCGDGPVDATYKAIFTLSNTRATLQRYVIRAVTSGSEAMGEVLVNLDLDGRVGTGRGVSTDIIEASAKALIDGLNRMGSKNS